MKEKRQRRWKPPQKQINQSEYLLADNIQEKPAERKVKFTGPSDRPPAKPDPAKSTASRSSWKSNMTHLIFIELCLQSKMWGYIRMSFTLPRTWATSKYHCTSLSRALLREKTVKFLSYHLSQDPLKCGIKLKAIFWFLVNGKPICEVPILSRKASKGISRQRTKKNPQCASLLCSSLKDV